MLSRVKELPVSHGFPSGSKLFVYNEVIDRDDGAVRVDEYYDTGILLLPAADYHFISLKSLNDT